MDNDTRDFTGGDFRRRQVLESAEEKQNERIDPQKLREKAMLRKRRVLQAAAIYTESDAINDIYATLYRRYKWLESQCTLDSGNTPEARQAYTERKAEIQSIIESIEKVVVEAEEYKQENT